MKAMVLILTTALAGLHALAQPAANATLSCDCPDCREKSAGETGYSLPGLEGFLPANDTPDPDGAEEDHSDHDHDTVQEDHAGHDHSDHDESYADADHDSVAQAEPGHEGHDHGSEAAVRIDRTGQSGIQVYEAEGGTISRSTVFPAEIKLNRDYAAAVSPRYASVVRQVFAEIGDEVNKGDVLASLENRETLAVYTVSAPLNGTIISKDLSMGETAGADKVLYEVADLSTVWADISIFPQYQHLVSKGMPVEFVAHDGHTARGTVKYISPIVSHETRTFTARCILTGTDEDFTPGAFVRARIYTEAVEVPVRVELEAVQTVNGETVVFVPDGEGFDPVDVETGMANDRHVEIKRGLNPGDRYVAGGAFALKAELITSGMDPHAGHNH